MLEGVLKDDQMEWLTAMVAEKDDLRSKVETIGLTVDQFIRDFEEQVHSSDAAVCPRPAAHASLTSWKAVLCLGHFDCG